MSNIEAVRRYRAAHPERVREARRRYNARSRGRPYFATSEERWLVLFWARVRGMEDPHGCWQWTGYRKAKGYAVITVDGHDRMVHRVAWELSGRELDPALTLDHLCRNRICVNPTHLEQVTRGENTLRGYGPTALNARKTHCANGHPYSAENTAYTRRGHRNCLTCRRRWERLYRLRRQVA